MEHHISGVGAMSSPLLHDEDQGSDYTFINSVWISGNLDSVETLMTFVPTWYCPVYRRAFIMATALPAVTFTTLRDAWNTSLTSRQRKFVLASAVILTIGALVIFVPQIFYFSDHYAALTGAVSPSLSSSTHLTPLYQSSANKITELNEMIATVRAQSARSAHELRRAESSGGWMSRLSPSQQIHVESERTTLAQYQQVLSTMIAVRDLMAERQRALTPILSATAFDEARELYMSTQKRGAEHSVAVWKWEIVFQGMMSVMGFSQNRDAMEYVTNLALRLLWQLTIGVVISVVDFAIRIIWYIREYELVSVDTDDVDTIAEMFPSLASPSYFDDDVDVSDNEYNEEIKPSARHKYGESHSQTPKKSSSRHNNAVNQLMSNNNWQLSLQTNQFLNVWQNEYTQLQAEKQNMLEYRTFTSIRMGCID